MNNLSVAEMLNIWEHGLHQPPIERALILLSAAFPDMLPGTLLELSIGQRDWMLLRIREHLFGSQLVNTATCPECNEQIEWENKVTDFMVQTDTPEFFEFQENDYLIRFRLPNSLDIAAVTHVDAPETSQRVLVARCLLQAEYSDSECAIDDLPEEIVQKLMREIEESDPMAEIRIRLTCPACSHDWDVLFDITSFLWTEINDWAVRMLQTVHKWLDRAGNFCPQSGTSATVLGDA
jgi:hypothetical protein